MKRAGGLPEGAVRSELAAELSRRDFMRGAGGLGLGALVLGALPIVEQMVGPVPASAQASPTNDGILQAFWDTIIPGKKVSDLKTELGNPIDPRAIAGVDPEHGAVYTDALLLGRNPKIGFSALEGPLVAELDALALGEGGRFLELDYEGRERVCETGLDFDNPTRPVWEAGAAVAFTAFCAAANIPDAQSRHRDRSYSAGYAVMGHPGTAPHGYGDFSYGLALNRERTKQGYLD